MKTILTHQLAQKFNLKVCREDNAEPAEPLYKTILGGLSVLTITLILIYFPF